MNARPLVQASVFSPRSQKFPAEIPTSRQPLLGPLEDSHAPQEPLEFSPKGKTLPTASPDSRPNARSSSGKEGEAISKGAFSRRSLHALSDVFGLRDASYDVSLHVLGAEEADVPDVPASMSEHNPKAHLRG
ncbi:unnamed protein product [Lampetra fluviatilis]